MTRNVNDFLASGEAGNISATNLIAAANLQTEAADVPDADRPNICMIQDTSGHLFRVIYSSVQDQFFASSYFEAT